MSQATEAQRLQDLTGYEVVVGVCGGIAAYKVCEVVSALVQRGAGVAVAMTNAAQEFVGPVTFQALSGRPVLTSLWDAGQAADIRHITLSGSADLMLVAPATADVIARIAHGLANDVVTTMIVSAASPVVLAPAMNDRMWANPMVQRNVTILKEAGFAMLGPGEGWLACRSVGPGRMVEPAEIVEAVATKLKSQPPKIAGIGE